MLLNAGITDTRPNGPRTVGKRTLLHALAERLGRTVQYSSPLVVGQAHG
jgi:hypothetical protein